jgi:hypothetical protein
MKLAVMQPYAFAYLGYFQLIHAVDRFVLLDDAAYRKQSWINRNVLGARNGPQNFSLAVRRPSLGQAICDVRLHQPRTQQLRLLKTIETIYRRAPHYREAMLILERAILQDKDRLAPYIRHSLEVLNAYLGITTPLVSSSERHQDLDGKGQARLIKICRAEGAISYINPEGGVQLYRGFTFRQHGIELSFLVHEPRPYRQNSVAFLPRLSIIDVMMFNSREEIARLLGSYRLMRADDEA